MGQLQLLPVVRIGVKAPQLVAAHVAPAGLGKEFYSHLIISALN